jgi:hypothetical protein
MTEPCFEGLVLSEDIWWLIRQDEQGRRIRQSQGFDAVCYQDVDRTWGRYSVRLLEEYAARLETVSPGAGSRYLIGQIGRMYTRLGMKDDWEQLMGDWPPALAVSRGYRSVKQVERLLVTLTALRPGET